MNFGTPMLKRLPLYLRACCVMESDGEAYVSAAELASILGFDPIVVRKDLARTGVRGKPRSGFPLTELIAALKRLTGVDANRTAVLVGVGRLGAALLGYPGFRNAGLTIAAGFDAAPERCQIILSGVPVFPVNTLTETCLRLNADLGILTVPAECAQHAANQLVAGGVRAIWNFTPVQLDVPERVHVKREDLAVSLAVLLHHLHEKDNNV